MRPVRKDVGPANTETAYPTFFLKQLKDQFDCLATWLTAPNVEFIGRK